MLYHTDMYTRAFLVGLVTLFHCSYEFFSNALTNFVFPQYRVPTDHSVYEG